MDRLGQDCGYYGILRRQGQSHQGHWAKYRGHIINYQCPLLQGLDHPDRSRGKLLHPSYFVVFGIYRKVNVVNAFATMPPEWVIGEDN